VVAHPCKDSAHVGEALDDAGHGVLRDYLVFEVDVARILDGDQRLEDSTYRHDAFADSDLGFAAVGVGKVLDMEIEEAWAGGVDRSYDVSPRTDGVAEVDAEADARVHLRDSFEDVEGRREVLVLRAVIMDGELDVVFLDKLFEARKVLVRWSADGDRDAGGLEVFEFGADIFVVVLGEGDIARSGELKIRGAVGSGLGGHRIQRRHRKMHVFEIEIRRLKLVHVIDEVRRVKVTKGVAGDAEPNGEVCRRSRRFERGWHICGRSGLLALGFGMNERGGGGESASAKEVAASEWIGGVCHRRNGSASE
jgi:hypothetical protein